MKKLILLILAIACFSCEAPKSQETSFNKLVKEVNNGQMDQIMTIWFGEFMKQQNKGKTMNEADRLALHTALSTVDAEAYKTLPQPLIYNLKVMDLTSLFKWGT